MRECDFCGTPIENPAATVCEVCGSAVPGAEPVAPPPPSPAPEPPAPVAPEPSRYEPSQTAASAETRARLAKMLAEQEPPPPVVASAASAESLLDAAEAVRAELSAPPPAPELEEQKDDDDSFVFEAAAPGDAGAATVVAATPPPAPEPDGEATVVAGFATPAAAPEEDKTMIAPPRPIRPPSADAGGPMSRGPVGPDDATLVSDEPGGGPQPASAPFGMNAPGSLAGRDEDMADTPTIVPGFGAPAMPESLCPGCGMANGPDSAFCIRCGGSLRAPAANQRPSAAAPLPPPPMPEAPPATAICGECGAENDPGSRFCIQCGGRVGGVVPRWRGPQVPRRLKQRARPIHLGARRRHGPPLRRGQLQILRHRRLPYARLPAVWTRLAASGPWSPARR